MNLTKCFVAGLCATAMTASASFLGATNDFEGGTLEGVWTGGINATAIVDASTGVTDANSPIVGVTDSKLLKLDTEGGVWTNEVTDGSFASAPVYADMLVKFVPSEELPSVDSAVKLAIAVTNGYLAVTKDDGLGGNVWVGTSTAIDTSLWYRVTVMLTFEDPLVKATVKINETAVTVDGNTLFDITDNEGFQTLNSIGFQGTGFIDEVAVRNDDPFGSSTVAFGGTGPQVDPLELNAWKLANEITGTEDPDSFNAFVMNVAPEDNGNSPVLVVNSIVVDGTTTLTVMAKYADDSLVALGTPLYNGAVLTVWGKVDLDDVDWVNLGTDLTEFDQTTYQFFTVTTGEAPTL